MTAPSEDSPRRSDEERRFLAAYDPSAYERPSVAVDVALLTVEGGALHALMAPRARFPDRGRWALPGGFVRIDESLPAAAQRVLRDRAGLEGVFVEQLFTFGAPDRDPRMRVIAVAYYALVSPALFARAQGVGRACRLRVPWEGEAGGAVEALGPDGGPLPLAFDHADILGSAVLRIRGKLAYAPLVFELLPPAFTILQARQVHEVILGRRLNKDSFRRTFLASRQVVPTGEKQTGVGYRPAALYRRA